MAEIKTPPVRQLKRILRKFIGCSEEEMPVALIVLASAYVGDDEVQLQKDVKLGMIQIRSIMQTLRRSGVLSARNRLDDYMKDGGSISLGCDITCGLGILQRSAMNGKPAWRMTKDGKTHVEKKLIPKPVARAKAESEKERDRG